MHGNGVHPNPCARLRSGCGGKVGSQPGWAAGSQEEAARYLTYHERSSDERGQPETHQGGKVIIRITPILVKLSQMSRRAIGAF